MKGIKEHTHSERQKVIKEMTPLIRNKFGDNLLALAVCCSYARNDDHLYSDLELIAFVKEMPQDKTQGGLAKIVDGMLIELMWMTKETYLNTVLDVNEYWHYSGSDTLLPIINAEFINELKDFQPMDLKRKCLEHAVGVFTEYQEATSKVLNAISQNNNENMAVLFFDMINQILLSLIHI